MFFYVPLEPYAERYTGQLSKAKTGWFESELIKQKVKYTRIEGTALDNSGRIKTGSVLDACNRPYWALSQIQKLIELVSQGKITSADQIYFDDMFHPGIEGLFYAMDQKCVCPDIGMYCWAQSFDQYDFTRKMQWMRSYEEMVIRYKPKIFVANTLLKDFIMTSTFEIRTNANVQVVGLPFGGYTATASNLALPKKNQVVFSSRLDSEKNPHLFIELARLLPDTKFIISNPRKALSLQNKLTTGFLTDRPKNLRILNNVTKEQYYKLLCESKFQFNCADQDWVSYTLLEAVSHGCFPVYPNFRSFPETLHRRYLYTHRDMKDAADMIQDRLDVMFHWSDAAMDRRQAEIVNPHTYTIPRIIEHMIGRDGPQSKYPRPYKGMV